MSENIPKLAKDYLEEKFLYKYRFIEKDNSNQSKPDNQKLKYIENIFTKNELFFPSPLMFNDPLECRPSFFVGDMSDENNKNKYIAYVMKVVIADGNSANPDDIAEWLGKHTQEEIEQYCKRMTDGVKREYNKQLRICSFSAINNNPLLWSHYSDSHRGFCLIFDASNESFGGAMKVEYQDEYPMLDFTDEDEYKNLNSSSLVKYSDWSYEKEYRLISREPAIINTLPVIKNIWVFPKEMLKGVIFGCAMLERDRSLIKELCKSYSDDFCFKEVRLHDDKYILQIVDVD